MLPSSSYSRARFGSFELNLKTRELRNGSQTVLLQEQPYKILVLLLERGTESATREEIKSKLWSNDTTVDFEHGINAAMRNLRRFLDDSPDNPRYIETLARRVGYRFLVPVLWVDPTPPESLRTTAIDQSTRLLNGTDVGAPAAERRNEVIVRADSGPRTRWLIVIAVVVVGAVAWGYLASRRPAKFSDKDSIVLADFDNKTGDTVFDDTLKQGLSVQLEQSPLLALVSEERVNDTLKLMGRSAGDRLTPEVTREVCQRAGSKAMVDGAIGMLGSQYVIGLKAVNCNDGDVMGEVLAQAASKEEVLKVLGDASISLRGKLGESLSSVQKYATPLVQASTPSLEALKAYSLGVKERAAKGETTALPFFNRAVELDPNFALAHRTLAVVYANLGESARAAESAGRAYRLRENVSERERLSIEACYYTYATGELEKAAQSYEQWQQIYPRDSMPYVNLGFVYGFLGNWEKAVVEDREALFLEPSDEVNYNNLGYAYGSLNRLDEEEALYQQAEEHKLEGESLLANRYQLAFLKGDKTQMNKAAADATNKVGTEDLLLAYQANTEAWYGRLNNSRDLIRQAMHSAQQNDAKETAATYQVAGALYEVELGNRERALADADAALKLAANLDVRKMAGLVFARAGDVPRAQRMADELDKELPLDTIVQEYWLPTIRAAIALHAQNPSRAIELLKVATPIELSIEGPLGPAFMRGEAYLMLHDGDAAAAEFQKFLEHYGLVANAPLGALARLGLARAYAIGADKDIALRDKARAAYQNFLSIWKDADPDIPLYQQAKAEYARLH